MITSALIAAAGLPVIPDSSHPLDPIGSITSIERIVATLRKSGVNRIVVVTGYKSEELERLLVSSHVIFLHNENYKDTDMLSSVKIGLSYLKDKTDRILFTPADIPLFTCKTVRALLAADASIALPVCSDHPGHPVLFTQDLIEPILAFDKPGGLHAFLEQYKASVSYVPVEDRGIFLHNDGLSSPEYQKQLELHNRDIVRINLSIGLAREKTFFDEQVFNLLLLIDETSNVRKACNHLHISYTTSWNLIQRLESQLQCQLVARAKGGSSGSHSELTPMGKELIKRYADYREEISKHASDLFGKYFHDFF